MKKHPYIFLIRHQRKLAPKNQPPMQKYKGKYRNESRRLRGWDYSRNGHYFITINTYNRACLFGDIKNGKMILNDFGKIATDEWYRSFEIRK
jgi:hypothetical protein